jgi:hypothetical protein
MKKAFVIGMAFISAQVFAYNPPAGAESYFHLGNAGGAAASVAGGGNFSAGPYSQALNPALIAGQQTVQASLGYTAIAANGDGMGNAVALSLLLPSRWGVWAGSLSAVFSPLAAMPLRNTFAARFSFARDISDTFYLGASLFAGGDFNNGAAAAADVGLIFRLGSVAFLRDARAGFTLANMGKTFTADYGDDFTGIINNGGGHFPSILTPAAGFAATLIKNNTLAAGFSTDISLPSFQNALWSLGLDLVINDALRVSAGYGINAREAAAGFGAHHFYATLGYTFIVNTGKNEFMKARDWQKSDITVSAGYQSLQKDISLISAGIAGSFGARDNEGPVIKIGE